MDKVLSSKPVDALAARVTGKGVERPSNPNTDANPCFDECPEMQPIPRPYGSNIPDIRGQKLDGVTIIGFYESIPKGVAGGGRSNGDTRWVAQCDCGKYIIIMRKKIMKQRRRKGKFVQCSECWYFRYLQNKLSQSTHKSHGSANSSI